MGPTPSASAPPRPPPGLPHVKVPDGWRAEFDEKWKAVYYINLKTNKTQWNMPPGPAISREGTPEPVAEPEHYTHRAEPEHTQHAALEPHTQRAEQQVFEHTPAPAQGEYHAQQTQAEHAQPQPQKQGFSEMMNNTIAGAQAGFTQGRSGQGYQQQQQYDPNDPYYQQRHHGLLGRGGRRQHGGLIHGVIGGLMGAIEGGKGNYKDPVTTQSGGRVEGTPSPAPVHHSQESGVHHTTGTYGGPAPPPPDYAPSEEKDY